MPSGRRLDNGPRDASKSKKGVQGRRGALARVPGAPECAGLGQVGKPAVTDSRRNAIRRAERLVGAKAQRYVITHPTGRQASFPPWEELARWRIKMARRSRPRRPHNSPRALGHTR